MNVKITNGDVDTYPYNVGQLRRDNPITSFPKQIPAEILESYGVFSVTYTDPPIIDVRTQKAEQQVTPSLVDGDWTLGWDVIAKQSSEIDEYDSKTALNVREERGRRLAECDWTQMADSPLTDSKKAEWSTYRQSLRDITGQSGFPFNVTYPTEPS